LVTTESIILQKKKINKKINKKNKSRVLSMEVTEVELQINMLLVFSPVE